MTILFRNVVYSNGQSKLNARFATVALDFVGPVIVDAQERKLKPMTQQHSDVVIDWAWVDAKELCRRLDRVEEAASELFGDGPWTWVLDITDTYHVCKCCGV